MVRKWKYFWYGFTNFTYSSNSKWIKFCWPPQNQKLEFYF